MKEIVLDFRDYLTELVSGLVSIALLLVDLLGLVLLFLPGFPGTRVAGVLIIASSFAIANFRIYRRYHRLPGSVEDQKSRNLHLLRSLLCEIQANADGDWIELSDDVWQHHRDDIYWLPVELQEQLLAHYRALRLFMSSVQDGLTTGWIDTAYSWFADSLPAEVGAWRSRTETLSRSFRESLGHLPEALRAEIERLNGKPDK